MKIMYRKYGKKDYEEITLQELKHRISIDYADIKYFGFYITVLEKVEENALYFGAEDFD